MQQGSCQGRRVIWFPDRRLQRRSQIKRGHGRPGDLGLGTQASPLASPAQTSLCLGLQRAPWELDFSCSIADSPWTPQEAWDSTPRRPKAAVTQGLCQAPQTPPCSASEVDHLMAFARNPSSPVPQRSTQPERLRLCFLLSECNPWASLRTGRLPFGKSLESWQQWWGVACSQLMTLSPATD